jgi:2-keto-4-pentenoate hydratase
MEARRLDADAVAAAAALLAQHRVERMPIEELPAALRPADLVDAYAVQDALVDLLCERHGGHRIGWKVACTNPVAQAALRVDTPMFGRLLSHSSWPDPVVLEAARFTTRVIECEFAFRMGRDVPTSFPPLDAGAIVPFVETVLPSIEIVDHRFADWSLGAPSVAADNAIHGGWVYGDDFYGDWRTLQLAEHPLQARVDGALVASGTGAAVLGHPLDVLVWLAGELPRYGHRLRAGDVVTTGVCTDVFTADAGSSVVGDFGPLGTVSLRWS